jgi:uncharacterized protein YrrD
MRRARTIVGLPIISLAEGLRVGEVRDVVFDPDHRTIAALVVSEATWRQDAELIPLEHVRSFGRDAVTMQSLAGLVKARGQPQLQKLLTSGVKLDGLLVMTEGGNYLGILDEILVGPKGEMIAYEISVGFAEDVNHGKCLLPADEAVTVGHDVATFPDSVERLAAQPLPEVELEPAPGLAPGDVRSLQPTKPATA